jgi:hypothetical protein
LLLAGVAAIPLLTGCAPRSAKQRLLEEEAAARPAARQSRAEQQKHGHGAYVPDEPVVPVEKCQTPPEQIRSVPPVYSFEMMQAKAEGIVQARLLVGSDGAVKHVQITGDIGADSGEITRETLMKYRFKSARKDGSPVATWISMSVNSRLPRR